MKKEDDILFVSEIASLARWLNIKTNAINSYWREGKYSDKEKSDEIKKAYQKFLGEIIRLLIKEQQIPPDEICSPKDVHGWYQE